MRRMLAAPTFACEFEQVTSALRIPFAWSDRLHRMVSPTEVDRGWECGCTCKGCGARVQARQGAKNRHHFAHLGDAECSGGLETSIHFTAKQIIEAEKKLWLPAAIAFPFYPHNMRPIRAVKSQMLTVERVEVEASLNDIRPDLVLWKKERPLAVEIEVTHPVDEPKAQTYESMGVSALAINLRAVARSMSIEELRTRLMSPSTDTRWVFNRMADSLASTFRRETVKRSLTWRTSHKRAGMIPHVDSCPLRPRESKRHQSTFANAKLDCPGCPYYFPPENSQRIYAVRCSGHLAAQYPEAISEDWLHRIDGGG